MRGSGIALAILALLSALVGVQHFSHAQSPRQPEQAQYAGSARCASCHQSEHAKWTGSHHAASMQHASDNTVLGRFDGASVVEGGVETTFTRRDGKHLIRTDGPDGKTGEFEVKYTFGLTPLQQYLIELPGGRLQAFGIAWDSRPASEGGQKWFHLYPGRKLVAGDPLHWTGSEQNWNYQCAFCHSTNLEKNYDPASRTFKTTWSEINVGCEACHGPASRHVAWASGDRGGRAADPNKGFEQQFDERRGVSWAPNANGRPARSAAHSGSKEIQVCAACHSRREQFSNDGASGTKFVNAFRATRIETPFYHSDGQQREEVFNLGSFLQSRMYSAGVTCSDCHDPHSGKLRLTGNAVCTQCHAGEKYDAPLHHHHKAASAGAQCTSCHMPTTVYMGVDARHDHSFRIPRPDRTYVLGTPNACNQCHSEQSPQWARDALRTWFPTPSPGAQSFVEAFDLGDRGAPGAQRALIRVVEDTALSALVRASAIARLARYPSREVFTAISRALLLPDPDIRTAAIAALSNAPASTRQALLAPLLHDPNRIVRMDAARALAGESEARLMPEDLKLFQRGLDEYEAAQSFNAERPESLANLGMLYSQRGLVDKARESFSRALEIDRTFYPAAISLAELERAAGDEAAAARALEAALGNNPGSAPLLHALGLSLTRLKRSEEALPKLADAARLAPDEARFAYVYAVALRQAGRLTDAITVLKSAISRRPYDRDLLSALIPYEYEARDFTSALARAELLATLEPERADVQQMITRLRQQR